MNDLHKYIKKIKYLVIHQDKTPILYSSLRAIANKIQVDPSTISKNLKNNNEYYCISKKTKSISYIRKL